MGAASFTVMVSVTVVEPTWLVAVTTRPVVAATAVGVPETTPVVVLKARPAGKAGLLPDDVVLRFGTMDVENTRTLLFAIAKSKIDECHATGVLGAVAVSEGGVWQLGGCHTPTGDAVQDYPLRSLPVPSTGRSGINHRDRIDGEGGVGPRPHTTKL